MKYPVPRSEGDVDWMLDMRRDEMWVLRGPSTVQQTVKQQRLDWDVAVLPSSNRLLAAANTPRHERLAVIRGRERVNSLWTRGFFSRSFLCSSQGKRERRCPSYQSCIQICTPSLCLSLCVSLYLSLYVSLCLSVFLYLSLCLSVCLCVSLYLSLCLSVYFLSLSVSLSVCLSLSLYLSLCLSLSLLLSVCLSLCFSISLSFSLSMNLSLCLSPSFFHVTCRSQHV